MGKRSLHKEKILVCKYCGQRAERLLILALLVDLGCSVHPSPEWCPDSPNHEHEFIEVEREVED